MLVFKFHWLKQLVVHIEYNSEPLSSPAHSLWLQQLMRAAFVSLHSFAVALRSQLILSVNITQLSETFFILRKQSRQDAEDGNEKNREKIRVYSRTSRTRPPKMPTFSGRLTNRRKFTTFIAYIFLLTIRAVQGFHFLVA